MSPEQYLLLCEKYFSGTCTPEEEKSLLEYRDHFKMLDDQDQELKPEEKVIRRQIYKNIDHTLSHKTRKTGHIKLWLAAAAALIIVTAVGLLFIKQRSDDPMADHTTAQVKKSTIKPGTETAILTLSDGSSIVLDEAANGVLSSSGSTTIKKVKDGLLSYSSTEKNTNAKVLMNTITTPRGGHYTITLPDGTKVWLNAASSLSYPTVFTGSERSMTLKGEAYFEVAKNKDMPFVVQANQVKVKVLGTHFNVAAYQEDAAVKTTLLEGSVRLSTSKSTILLAPGEQGVANAISQQIESKQVNTNQAVAWKNGYFIFRDDRIQDIMIQISRWYNVDVEYRGNMSNKTFGGIYSRNKDINELLKGLELTGLIHFKIEGRRIIVMS